MAQSQSQSPRPLFFIHIPIFYPSAGYDYPTNQTVDEQHYYQDPITDQGFAYADVQDQAVETVAVEETPTEYAYNTYNEAGTYDEGSGMYYDGSGQYYYPDSTTDQGFAYADVQDQAVETVAVEETPTEYAYNTYNEAWTYDVGSGMYYDSLGQWWSLVDEASGQYAPVVSA